MKGGADIAAGRFAHHGGRLCVARALFPDVTQPWIDLSTGINPSSYPAPRASARERNRLPEPTDLAKLEATAAAAFGVDDPARVVATGGTENVLRLLPYLLNVASAVIAGPTYGSHADAWTRAGIGTNVVADAELTTRAAAKTAMTVVTPNNPDGRVMSRERLLSLHGTLHANNGLLIVDEAFADLEPQLSVAGLAGTSRAPRMMVLRSFGKFYGLAGIRLGFVIASTSIATRLRHLLGDWPVSADALCAGLAAYADEAWAARTRLRLHRAAQRLDKLLVSGGMTIVGGTSLYRLARAPDARARFTQLASRGILARPFDYDSTLLRFGLPLAANDWRRVANALKMQP
ncbi:threonine-phosphate decarboxylase CobD [Peristeroidobacter soli]|uniref:threonine-phosphate decarboxylase CobD n=1 Tax=Peristeroidobacter soli TaxID=2497877 RepID=UPI00101CC203|nr:threonine-phosphate decarboxylase CobD [Peristeroidobacter soli]